ncbi:MAG: reverse transcriptase domain-containing protein [Bacteroidota bacterium]
MSPFLANLYLHYALDKWLDNTDQMIKYVRYADDVIIHCVSLSHAERLLKLLHLRMQSVGLELHPQKTKIVYCKDYWRKESYPMVKFDILGYSFQPRMTKSKHTKGLFLGFDCALSIGSCKRIADKLGELGIERLSFRRIVGIVRYLTRKIHRIFPICNSD